MALRNEHEELLAAWRSLGGGQPGDGWHTIRVGAGRCRAGVRFPEGEEALLVGFDLPPPAPEDLPQGRGFSVIRVGETHSAGFDIWLGISRKATASLELFTLMAADLMSAASSGGGERRTFLQLLSRIESWQHFMERPRDRRLSDEEELGLFGELSVVGRLLEGGMGPATVMEYWKGPANGLRDFMGPGCDIEVKATVSPNGFPARISSLEQLDDVAGRSVFLVALRFSVHDQSRSLPDLVAHIRERIGAEDAVPLERSLLLAGYEDAYAQQYVRGFRQMDERAFRIEEGFPRISRSTAALAIRGAKYELDLDLVDAATVDLDQLILALGSGYTP